MRTTRRGRVVARAARRRRAASGGAGAAGVLDDEPRGAGRGRRRPPPSPSPTAPVRGRAAAAARSTARAPRRRRARGGGRPGALADPALGGALAVSVLDADDRRRRCSSAAADVPLVPGVDREDRDGGRGAHRRCPPTCGCARASWRGRRRARSCSSAAATRRSPGPRRRSATRSRRASPTSPPQARAALGATAVTRVVVDDSLYTGERLAPGWKPTYVTEGAVAPVTALMVDGGRVRPGRAARARPSPRSTPAPRLRRAAAAGRRRSSVVRGSGAAPARPPLGEVASRARRRSSSSGCSSRATTTSPRRSPARSRSRPGGPASFAGVAEALAAVLAGAERRASSRTPCGWSTAAGCRATTALEPAAVTRLLARGRRRATTRGWRRCSPGCPSAGFDGTLAPRYRAGAALPAAGARPGQDRHAQRRQRAGRAACAPPTAGCWPST